MPSQKVKSHFGIFRPHFFDRYKIALIADLDKRSKSFSKDFWASYLLEGYLFYYPTSRRVDVRFQNEDQTLLKGTFSVRKRGMELSELIVFNGSLFTCDDRTGIVFRIIQQSSGTEHSNESHKTGNGQLMVTTNAQDSNGIENKTFGLAETSRLRRRLNEMGGMLNFSEQTENKRPYKLIPWLVLMDGDGLQEKPFKCEWMAVKDHHLYVGGLGKEWTTPTGEYVNNHPQWIKKISPQGLVTHLDWADHYKSMAKSIGIQQPGYVIHESAAYSQQWKRWVFLPRKASSLQYDEEQDEKHGTNFLIKADDDFSNVTFKQVGNLDPLHGFSSFKFIPNTDDQIVIAIKSMEYKDKVSTFIMAFDLDGRVLMEERLVNNEMKFEGIEFV